MGPGRHPRYTLSRRVRLSEKLVIYPLETNTVELHIFSLAGWEYPPRFGCFSVIPEAPSIRLFLPLITTSGQVSASGPVVLHATKADFPCDPARG